MRECVCLTHGRSGTEYIFSSLRKVLPCGEEIFNDDLLPHIKNDLDYFSIETIESYFNSGSNFPKIQFYQLLVKPNLLRLILDRWAIIFIGRRDLFKKNLSIFAARNNKWHIKEDENFEYSSFYVPVDEFKLYYQLSIDQENEFFELAKDKPDVLYLYYEDIIQDLDEACRSILDLAEFNHSEIKEFKTDFKKGVRDYKKIVINYEELVDATRDK